MVNPMFGKWYTDTVDIFRVVTVECGNLSTQERQKICSGVPCRVYSTNKATPGMSGHAAQIRSVEKLACDLSVDIRAGDELFVIRGGTLGCSNEPERYFAGKPQSYHDPVGGVLTGLEHKEVALSLDEVVG